MGQSTLGGHVHSSVGGQVTMGGQVGHVSVGHTGSEEHVYNGDLITLVTNSQQNWQQNITIVVNNEGPLRLKCCASQIYN